MTSKTKFRREVFLRANIIFNNSIEMSWANSLTYRINQFIRVTFFTLIFFLFSTSLQAQSVKETAEQAEKLSYEGKHEQVIELLKDKKKLFYDSQITDYKLFYNETLGYAYYQVNDLVNAETLYTEIIDAAKEIYGKENINYELYLNTLAIIYLNLGDTDKAIDYYTQVKEIQEKTKRQERDEYATILNILGGLYENKSDYELAEKYYLESKEIRERVLGKLHPSYATSLHSLGSLFVDIGNYELAEDYLLESKEIREQILGKEHPHYATTLSNLGALYKMLGNYELAKKYALESKEIRGKILGKEHPDYAYSLNLLGGLYDIFGDYKLAEKYYLESKEIREQILGRNHVDYYQSLNNLGVLYIKSGSTELAEKYLSESKEITEKISDRTHPDYAISLSNLGSLYCTLGDYELAQKYYLESKEITEQVLGKKHPSYATSLNNLGTLYEKMGNYELAERYYLESKGVTEQILGNTHPDYATSLNNLGGLYKLLGSYKLAEKYYLESKDVTEQILSKNHPSYASSLNNLGSLYCNLGNYELAQKYYLEAKEITERVLGKNNSDYAYFMGNLGGLYSDLGDYELAEKYYLESKETIKEVLGSMHPDYATSLNNLGGLYLEFGDYKSAERYYLEAKMIREQVLGQNHIDYSISLNNLGLLYKEMGKYEYAERCLTQSIKITEEILGKENIDYAVSLNNLGYIYCALKKYELAEKYLSESKEITGKVLGNTHTNYATSINNLGELYLRIGNYKVAEKLYLESKEIREQAFGREHPDYSSSISNLSFLYFLMGEFNLSAQFCSEESLNYKEDIYRNFSFMSEKQRALYWEKEQTSMIFPFSLLSAYPIPEIKVLSYNNTLFTKGLLLQTNNNIRNDILSSNDSDLISIYNNLSMIRRQITMLETQSNSNINAYTDELEVKADSLDKVLTQSSNIYKEEKDKFNIDWTIVRDNLLDNEVAVEFIDYWQFNKELRDSIMYCALIIKHDSQFPEYIPLCEKKDLDFISNSQNLSTDTLYVHKTYNSGNPRFFNGDKLYELIWEPIEKHLEGIKTIYYSPSGLLNKVSFAAIPVDSIVLGDKYSLHLVSSTREVVLQKRNKENVAQKVKNAVAYGGIIYSASDEELLQSAKQTYNNQNLYASRFIASDTLTRSSWGPLYGTLSEVNEIERLLKQTNISNIKFVGTDANEESFKQLSGNSPELIHIATHGFFLEDEKDIQNTGFMQMLGGDNNRKVFSNPLLRSGLLMAGANRAWLNEDVIEGIEDGILTAEEIANLDLTNTKLVVLSACETGLGEVKNSEGVFGLQRAFKLAGVESIIMSLWKVPDNTTSMLMRTFYKNWLGGMNKYDAFQNAQQEIRTIHPEPYSWAGFVMMD